MHGKIQEVAKQLEHIRFLMDTGQRSLVLQQMKKKWRL